ncbi:hypothetical protein [Chryseobacterium taiwanense]|nr:hypothetical protein [Chryseobacterium taiwanense]
MKESKELTSDDIKKIKRINFLRIKKDSYILINLVTISLFLYSFGFPYWGWRRKPLHPPTNMSEYLNQIIDLNIFCSPLYFLVFFNILIKFFEIKYGYKFISQSEVIFKRQLLRRLNIIIFKPFKVLFFSNKFKYNDLKEKDDVQLERTILGRVLNYKKYND